MQNKQPPANHSLEALIREIRAFCEEREWRQFHNPKDLATALSIEASELQELFLWKTRDEIASVVQSKRSSIEQEIADIAIYLLDLVDVLGIDLPTAIHQKLALNRAKYPIALARGSSLKYDELGAPQPRMDDRCTLESSIITSLDGEDPSLLPFIPYLLQDLWSLGSDPRQVLALLEMQAKPGPASRVLDIACGKGACAIPIAQKWGCQVLGLDAFSPFIEDARIRALTLGVGALCQFECTDVRQTIGTIRNQYDIVLLAAVGSLLGDYDQSLNLIKPLLKPGALLLIDDAWMGGDQSASESKVFSRAHIEHAIQAAGFEVLQCVFAHELGDPDFNEDMAASIETRCRELANQIPEKAQLFDAYWNKQKAEFSNLETDYVPFMMLLKKP
jgi:ubiquinone/menaquinone biosynthesis C-methylase UbiE/NTP pyrophosphatase (non-canonical NTP hydrolase)